ncbi:hypothetical protein GX51_05322 [Blastomyces parvus]|uniref:Rad60/SUMO-like domain-containing protein n=1 Tax=Blastomyces parvus TaxID=2060905 RepID=A0A2B7WXH3_9EURO|nr:hypothetical protein GX51_05322 [Blastomyces parvus]
MRSFFKKPDWAKTDSNPGQSAEFYRRSEQVYTDIISREPERDQRSEDDEKNEGASHNLQDGKLQELQPSLESNGSKRRRMSREKSAPSTTCISPGSERWGKGEEDQAYIKETICSMQRMQQAPAAAMSHTQVKNLPAKVNNELHPPTAVAVELDSDSSKGSSRPKSQSVQALQTHSKQPPKHELDDGEDDGDDLYAEEEYAELARKARARARLQRAASAGNAGPDPPAAGARTTQSPNLNHTTKSTSNTPDRQNRPIEPIVRILITSDLPNTNPLIVQRRLNQDLRDVRRAWCSRQGFDDEMTASIFLTWKCRRLFDVTTCKSLGVQEDKEKGLLQPLPIRDYYNDNDDDGSGQDGGSLEVHMEAVTEKLFEEKRRQAAKASHGEFGSSEDEDDDGDDDEGGDGDKTAREAQQKQDVLLIILKSPGIEDLKIRVRHKTHISSIIRSFRERRNIPTHRTVQLLFDGDQLHPDSIVADNDMADLDAIDVRIK